MAVRKPPRNVRVTQPSVHRAEQVGMLRRLASRPGSLLTLLGVGLFLVLAVVGPFFAPLRSRGAR